MFVIYYTSTSSQSSYDLPSDDLLKIAQGAT
jgi:hypothetical protein